MTRVSGVKDPWVGPLRQHSEKVLNKFINVSPVISMSLDILHVSMPSDADPDSEKKTNLC